MSKGSWDRSDPAKKDQSEYWKAENVEKRKMLANKICNFGILTSNPCSNPVTHTSDGYKWCLEHAPRGKGKALRKDVKPINEITQPNICSHCEKLVWQGTKRNPSTKCEIHFACVCDKCGHEAFWMKNKWVCFSLSCNWSSKDYTKSIMEDDYSVMKRKAQADGWTDIHGGDHGAYWRGINPETRRCEKLPKKYTDLLTK